MNTEEESRKKWCPYASMDGHNRQSPHGSTIHAANCIASDCMAWRWSKEPKYEPGARHPEGLSPTSTAKQMPSNPPEGYEWVYSDLYDLHERAGTRPNHFWRWALRRIVPVGYCGLAGKP